MGKMKIVSVIIPCLNEAQSIAKAIDWVKTGLKKISKSKFKYEIIVVNNGSNDGSDKIARKSGALVISEPVKGYGKAYIAGYKKSKGDYIVMGDADATYDFRQIPEFIKKLETGYDLVLGSRFMDPKSAASIPLFNRIIGNPLLTGLINLFYSSKITDTQTGFRAFTKSSLTRMNLRSTGMELASEMIIKAIASQFKITEIPIRYYPRTGLSKLSPLTDAWRHIQSIFMYSPTYALIIPGLTAIFIGLSGTVILISGPVFIGKIMIDIHTMISFVLLSVLGVQILLSGLIAKIFTFRVLGIPGGFLTKTLIKNISFRSIFSTGLILTGLGAIPLLDITYLWINSGFSSLSKTREFIAGSGFIIIGVQMMFTSFIFKLLDPGIMPDHK